MNSLVWWQVWYGESLYFLETGECGGAQVGEGGREWTWTSRRSAWLGEKPEALSCAAASSNKQGTYPVILGISEEEEREEKHQPMSCLTNTPIEYQLRSQGCCFRSVSHLNWNINFTSRKSSLGHKSLADRKKSTTCGLWMKRLGLWGAFSGLQKGLGCSKKYLKQTKQWL